MRIFVAGATGVIGIRLVPLLVAEGHEVAGMTRSPTKADQLRAFGAGPVVCDVFDAEAVRQAVRRFEPDVIVDELTDLPDRADEIAKYRERNDRMRTEGTRNLIAAGDASGAERVIAQSIAWDHPDPGARAAVAEHERLVLGHHGVVVRYGQLYGPGTFYDAEPPPHPRIHVDEAARRTEPTLTAPSGIVTLVEVDQ
jgi:nucleoside-diphosphate-sugar epimerase